MLENIFDLDLRTKLPRNLANNFGSLIFKRIIPEFYFFLEIRQPLCAEFSHKFDFLP